MLNCPRDNTILQNQRMPKMQVRCCPLCHGVAISLRDGLMLAWNVRHNVKLPQVNAATVKAAVAQAAAGGKAEILRCPSHPDKPMRNFRRGDTQIDYCEQCRDLWLDEGEAKFLQQFLNKSGSVFGAVNLPQIPGLTPGAKATVDRGQPDMLKAAERLGTEWKGVFGKGWSEIVGTGLEAVAHARAGGASLGSAASDVLADAATEALVSAAGEAVAGVVGAMFDAIGST